MTDFRYQTSDIGNGGLMDSNGFEDMDVFQRAYRVSLDIHRVSLKLPKAEQYGLADQMRRASKSIPANLAE